MLLIGGKIASVDDILDEMRKRDEFGENGIVEITREFRRRMDARVPRRAREFNCSPWKRWSSEFVRTRCAGAGACRGLGKGVSDLDVRECQGKTHALSGDDDLKQPQRIGSQLAEGGTTTRQRNLENVADHPGEVVLRLAFEGTHTALVFPPCRKRQLLQIRFPAGETGN